MTILHKSLAASLVALALAGGPGAPVLAQTTGDKPVQHGNGMGSDETATVGDLTLTAGFAFATLPNAPVAGGFVTIANAGDADDRLIAVASNVGDRTEIHEMQMDGGIMKMRELAAGLPVPAGQTVTLQPGGNHIMFMDLHGALAEGDVAAVTLTFEAAGEVTMAFPVVKRPVRRGGRTDG